MSELTLVEFLTARLDEDEAVARAAAPGPWETHLGAEWLVLGPCGDVELPDPEGEADATHIARHDPARVLVEVQAKRAIVEAVASGFYDSDLEVALRLLASVFSDHPAYRQEWTP